MKSNRLLAGLLALAMTASLAGCGAASSAAPEATETPVAPAATEAPTEAPASRSCRNRRAAGGRPERPNDDGAD